MGNCLNCCNSSTDTLYKKYFALKFPHTTQYIYSDIENKFIEGPDINTWTQNLYCVSHWENWIVYNDDTTKITNSSTNHGHCKGILTWTKYADNNSNNKSKIGWLCHSVPNYPRKFTGSIISLIEHSEIIYGQSFQYIEIQYDDKLLLDIIQQIHIMDSNIYIEHYTAEFIKYKNIIFPKVNKLKILKITDDIIHIAKPYQFNIDIYSEYIATEYKFNWNIQTWKRGHKIKESTSNIYDIINMKFEYFEYTSHQDHSKWATTNNEYYWIGDLNRMTSQFNRGGGGFICKDKYLANNLYKLIN